MALFSAERLITPNGWFGRKTCPVCRGRPEYAANADGQCGISGCELTLTMRDIDGREPTVGDFLRACRAWTPRQAFAFLGYVEDANGPASTRTHHIHAHVVTLGHRCTIEIGRMNWHERYGNAHRKSWLDFEDVEEAVGLLASEYAAKHSAKWVGTGGRFAGTLPIIEKLSHNSGPALKVI